MYHPSWEVGQRIYRGRISFAESPGDGWVPPPPIADMLTLADRTHPLPVPEPRCGQVWVDSTSEFMITAVQHLPGGAHEWQGIGWASTREESPNYAPWPPPGAVLVAGPGAPWAPVPESAALPAAVDDEP